MSKKITEMYAFVILDDGMGKGDEGIPALSLPGIPFPMPMVGADMERVESLKKAATEAGLAQHGKIEIRRFTNMEVVETLESE